jgi:hypothetical protein
MVVFDSFGTLAAIGLIAGTAGQPFGRRLGPLMMLAGAGLLALGLLDWPRPAESPAPQVAAAPPAPAADPRPAPASEPRSAAAATDDQPQMIAKARADDRPAAAARGSPPPAAAAAGPPVPLPVARPAAADQVAAAPVGPLVATVSPAAPVLQPAAAEAVVTIKLSAPAAKPLALIYATIDGTAKAGEDYEPLRGSLTFQPGSRSAALRLRLLTGAASPASGQFDLVLTADPSALALPTRKLTVTIQDD